MRSKRKKDFKVYTITIPEDYLLAIHFLFCVIRDTRGYKGVINSSRRVVVYVIVDFVTNLIVFFFKRRY